LSFEGGLLNFRRKGEIVDIGRHSIAKALTDSDLTLGTKVWG